MSLFYQLSNWRKGKNMITVNLGFNERLQDQMDLREVVDLSAIEQDDLYGTEDAFDEWIKNIHPGEESEQE